MTAKNIAPLQQNPSKLDEVNFLVRISDSLPENCYLKSLFTGRLINWVEYQIKNDIAPDVLTELEAVATDARQGRDNWREKSDEWHRKYRQEEARARDGLAKIEDLTAQLESQQEQYAALDALFVEQAKELSEWRALYYKVGAERDGANAAKIGMENEIKAAISSACLDRMAYGVEAERVLETLIQKVAVALQD